MLKTVALNSIALLALYGNLVSRFNIIVEGGALFNNNGLALKWHSNILREFEAVTCSLEHRVVAGFGDRLLEASFKLVVAIERLFLLRYAHL